MFTVSVPAMGCRCKFPWLSVTTFHLSNPAGTTVIDYIKQFSHHVDFDYHIIELVIAEHHTAHCSGVNASSLLPTLFLVK
jgi:hypothetical protein